jgi:SNF2 family DNA or RNA helicase
MGLGKTLIMISFIYLFFEQKVGKKILIVCPKSVCLNWKKEFEHWSEKCDLKNFINDEIIKIFVDTTEEKKKIDILKKFKNSKENMVLVMNYEKFRILTGHTNTKKKSKKISKKKNNENKIETKIGKINNEKNNSSNIIVLDDENEVVIKENEKEEIEKEEENYDTLESITKLAIQSLVETPELLVIDESVKIKNSKTLNYKAIDSIKTRNRIILTGTPFQNNLMEYFNLTNFLHKDFWSKKFFENYFVYPILEGMEADAQSESVKTKKKIKKN